MNQNPVQQQILTPDYKQVNKTNPSGELLATLRGVTGTSSGNNICYHDHRVWIASSDGILYVYNALNHILLEKLDACPVNDEISSIQIISQQTIDDEDEFKLLIGFKSGRLSVWNTRSYIKEHEILCHDESINCMIQAGENVWTASSDKLIRIWNATTLQPIKKLTEHKKPIYSMVLVDKFCQIWTAGDDDTIMIRDAFKGYIIDEIYVLGKSTNITFMVYVNNHVWSSHKNGIIRIWNVKEKKCVKEIEAHSSSIGCLVATTKQVWSASNDKGKYNCKFVIKNL